MKPAVRQIAISPNCPGDPNPNRIGDPKRPATMRSSGPIVRVTVSILRENAKVAKIAKQESAILKPFCDTRHTFASYEPFGF
jgi:hypothetical protein